MNKIYVYIIGFSSLFMVTNSSAQIDITCTATSDCTVLGYTQTVDKCAGAKTVKCPFDESKVFCLEKLEVCEVGSILYSDKSCSKSVKVGGTPIGVVFNTEKKLALALSDGSKYWSPNGKDEDVTSLSNCTDSSDVYTCNQNGKDNTSKIVSQYGNSTGYAAGYCADYFTPGTNKGDWFLPSIGELRLLYNVKRVVNVTLGLLGKSALKEGHYWSSNEIDKSNSWKIVMSGGTVVDNLKVNVYSVSTVLIY